MDAGHFDSLSKLLSTTDSRRRLLAILASLPLLGALLGGSGANEATARRRGKERAVQRQRGQVQAQGHGKRKHKRKRKACQPEPAAKTCAGRCGSFLNNCGKSVTCTACLCNPACATCFTCQERPAAAGACVVDPAQQGLSCGGNGKVCQPNGACACVPTTCAAQGATCGTIGNGCGGHLACGACPSATPICVDNVCVPCTSNGQCAAGEICDAGACAACDVCASGCAFTSVQAAINATTPQLTAIRVCPGTYVENAEQQFAVHIARALRLVGAGDGAQDATNTILRPDHTNQTVVFVEAASSVVLQGLRLTGATGDNGRGMAVLQSGAQVTGCTITGNVADQVSGGIGVIGAGAQVSLTDTRVTGNTGRIAGGIDVQGAGAQLTLDTLSRVTGNTATNENGGIRALTRTSVALPSVDNVTGNTSFGANKNCGGDGSFTGPGAVCTTI